MRLWGGVIGALAAFFVSSLSPVGAYEPGGQARAYKELGESCGNCLVIGVGAYLKSQEGQAGQPARAISSSPGGSLNEILAGAALVAHDGQFLGYWMDKYHSGSIFNQYGKFGSKYESKSIWNEYGNYGSKYNDLSPWNEYTNKPPIFVLNGKHICYLTMNQYKTPRVDPRQLYVYRDP